MKIFPKLNDENGFKSIFLYLTIAAAVFLIAPYLDLQMALAQGDHGRDLYAFGRILHGDIPYRDFWWVYGPLMPYYYAGFFKMFGITVMSAILGKLTLVLLNSVLFYLILAEFAAAPLAFLGAVYYLIQQNDFFFTYNHIGGLTLMLLLMLLTAHFLKSRRSGYLPPCLAVVILLALVKLNFGIIALAAFTLTVFIADRCSGISLSQRKRFYLSAMGIVPLIIVLTYAWFLRGLSPAEIRQCLPFLPGDQPHEFPLSRTTFLLAEHLRNITIRNPFNILMSLLTFLGAVCFFRYPLSRDPAQKSAPSAAVIFTGFTAGLMILNLHEFLRSNIWYRLAWAQPQSWLLVFLMIAVLWRSVAPLIRIVLLCGIATVCFFQGADYMYKAYAVKLTPAIHMDIKTADHYLNHPRGKIYLAVNSPQWIETVSTTAEVMSRLMQDNETFLALPYDPLYYYLTDHKSPTRQLIFFDHIHIPPPQETSIIAELEHNRTNWILLSSRMVSKEYALGTFGETYCPLLADYIFRNFHVVYEFGDWSRLPGWTDPHGVRILKRDKPL